MNRREALRAASLGALALTSDALPGIGGTEAMAEEPGSYKHRIAFGAWMNDMRNRSLPLQQWPAPQLDDHTVEGILRVLDVISEAGYGYLDSFGLYATDDYPTDIVSAFQDRERNRRLAGIFRAAEKRGIRMVLPLGVMTWGWDRIIREDSEVRGVDHEGNPHAHAMCGAKEKSWAYIERLIDTMFASHDFGGVHLESADLGYCGCDECVGQHGTVGYNARLNSRAAEYIKNRHPDALVYVCPINWAPWGLNEEGVNHKFSGGQLDDVVLLSRHIDVFMDQGHRGRFIRFEDVPKLQCDYGTSGGLWTYHGARQDRLSYFLPYPFRAVQHIAEHHAGGARACLYYQGPMVNPAVEVNSAVAGRVMADVTRGVDDVLAEVIKTYYGPRSPEAAGSLAEVFLTAEEAYFGQWDEARFHETQQLEMPGEFMIGALFGTIPGPAACLSEPFLDAEGRVACKAGLKEALATLQTLEGQFDDAGRTDRIHRCLTTWLHMLTTVMCIKGEGWAE